MIVYSARDIRPFVMYCVNGKPRSSLLIESTDSMIIGYSRSCVAGAGCTRYIEPLQPRTKYGWKTDVAEALAETSRQHGKNILPEDKTFYYP